MTDKINNTSKTIIVTGGAGFIGSHLCKELALNGHIVISVDNYFTGTHKNHVDKVTYINGDAAKLLELVDYADVVFHLGEYSKVEQSFEDIDFVWENNKNGIYGVLKFCRKHNAKLIYAGSSTKYSDNGEGIKQSPYAWLKASNSDLVKTYSQWFNINYAITYFYNVYGPNEIEDGKYATLIAKFKKLKKGNQPLTVVSPGHQKRHFTHVDDIINGLILVEKYGHGDEYGIGSPDSYTILEIARLFEGEVKMLPERKGNRMEGELITSKTKSIGWEPKHNLKKHIQNFLEKL